MTREEAIDIIRKNIPHLGIGAAEMTEALNELIPELRESEDERIRDCIRCLTSLDQAQDVITDMGFTRQDILSWLEKQEQKPAWSEEDTEMYINVASSLRGYACGLENEEHKKHIKKELDWLENRFKSLRPQPHKEIYQAAKHDLAIKFMNYLDENRPEGKMSLSNGECEDIDKAFKENDWAKIMRYVEKYRPSWKPSEEQLNALNFAITYFMHETNYKNPTELRELYDDLLKLK